MLFDFSSAFSVVVCHLLTSYLKRLSASWITDWLTKRAVCEGWSEGKRVTNKCPEGTALSPYLLFFVHCTLSKSVGVCRHCLRVCIYMFTCVCLYNVHLCMYMCTCVYVYVYVYVYMCVCICVHVYVYVYMCVCMYMCTSVYVCRQRRRLVVTTTMTMMMILRWAPHALLALLSLCLLVSSAGQFFLSGHPPVSVCWSVLSLDTLESLSAALFCWSVFSLRTPLPCSPSGVRTCQ